MADEDPTAINRYDWERVVRRVRMNPSAKLVALAIATYASKGGTSMYPGVAKLAAVTGLTDKTVRAALKTLRTVGLLERTFDGSKNGRRGLADEYRMRRPVDLFERVHTLDVGESPESIECSDVCSHKDGSPELISGDPGPVEPLGEGPDDPEQGNSVPRTPEMSSGTPEMSSPNTGTQFPPPSHDHPGNQLHDQRDRSDSDVTTEGKALDLDALKAHLEEVDELDRRRKLKAASSQ